MTNDPLPPNATLRTVATELSDPIRYVRRVLQNAWPHGPHAVLRISVRSDRSAPDYVIDEPVFDEADQPIGSMMVGAYSGKTHRPLPGSKKNTDYSYWSTSGVGRADIAELLGKLRDFKPKGKPGAKRT